MRKAAVQDILERIDRLSPEDRQSVALHLAEQAESAWRQAVQPARRRAANKGINQQTIDRAIHKRRYKA